MDLWNLSKWIFFKVFGDRRLYDFIYRLKYGVKYLERGKYEIVQMRNYPDVLRVREIYDYSLKLPLDYEVEVKPARIAAVVHIFYVDMADEIKTLLKNIPAKIDVYISTTDNDKKFALEKIFAEFNAVVRVFENRGRDIAPAFVGFRDIYQHYDLCVHIHSKKSPHASYMLADWADYLYKSLLGSTDIVKGILKVMERDDVGIVFPQYFHSIRRSINWGKNYNLAQDFLNRLNIKINNRQLIEFPAGSMFWFKPKALAPLINSDLTFEDFPIENGQLDGTIAHAIERCFVYIAANAGYKYVKVTADTGKIGNTPTVSNIDVDKICRPIFTIID